MSDYVLDPAALPTAGQRTALRILRLFGWKVRFKPLPGPHGVAVVYPHTSNWDFVIGLLGKWTIGLPFRWLGKESLFKGLTGRTLGVMMRSWGGVPVERSTSTGATARLAATMQAEKWFWLALAPEGTRSYRPHWRSGFYHLAVAAKVPLLIVYIDYPNKELGVVDCIDLTGDPVSDMAAVRAAYHGHEGLHPELAAPIILAPPR
jgi:1-acyl-sn-glycerol-3-phosphate acyltransferase